MKRSILNLDRLLSRVRSEDPLWVLVDPKVVGNISIVSTSELIKFDLLKEPTEKEKLAFIKFNDAMERYNNLKPKEDKDGGDGEKK